MPKITKRSVDAAKPKDREFFLWDGELKGFGVRFSPTGRKTFVIQYRIDGRERRLKLGVFGTLTVDQARMLAKKRLG